MLAIVEHYEKATAFNGHGDFADRIFSLPETEPESSSDSCRHLPPVLDRGKVHKGNCVKGRAKAIRHGEGDSRLTNATRTLQRDEPAARYFCN
jgi:hypothetical protein